MARRIGLFLTVLLILGQGASHAIVNAITGGRVTRIDYQVDLGFAGGAYHVGFDQPLDAQVQSVEGCESANLVIIAADTTAGFETDETDVNRMISQIALAYAANKQVHVWVHGCLTGKNGLTYGKGYLVEVVD